MAAMAVVVGTKKKARKPYTITRPRERWSADEHDRFLDALLLFGRDWKRIQRFVATKTAIQIRRHAQKHFLKARKLGLAVGLPPPPVHPRRAALLQANAAAADMMPPPWLPSAGGGSNSIGCSAPPSGVQQSMADWPPACYSSPDEASFRPLIHSSDDCSFIGTPNCSGSGEEWLRDAAFFLQDETILLPISPDDLGFAQVYKFVGDVFGSGERRPVEAHLRRLQGMDPAISETILLILKNLEANLAA